jgi:tRNA-uridine 2-sulfurtransferase
MKKVQKIIKKTKKQRVFVGLSGGVDSSVSAALLKEQGFDVSGVFIKVWQPNFWGGCTMKEDRLDAMRVCAKLDIPFYTLDLEKEYKKEVVDYMISEYKKGRTPNPDVMCNKYVKFGGFFDWAMKKGADYVATGHYARILNQNNQRKIGQANGLADTCFLTREEIRGPESELFSSGYYLLAGKDKNKDQSYFLWTLTPAQLSKTLFPVGDIEKPEVRKLAKKYNLQTAEKRDSQGLCFIGKVDMADFLKHFIKTKSGAVLNEEGEVIGIHDGAELYTIGQRHGFHITKNSPADKRSFVIKKDISNNTITISNQIINKGKDNSKKEFTLSSVNWTLGVEPNKEKKYQARIRYRGALDECKIQDIYDDKCKIIFKNKQNSPASGQSIVIYDGEICLGGGIIE